MKKILIWSYTLTLLLSSCQTADKGGIDLSKPAGTITVKFSDLAENLQAIPLETTDSCLLSGYIRVWVGNKYIATADGNALHLFDKKGKHLKRLAKKGKGPGEFSSVTVFTIDESGERLYYCDHSEKEKLRVIDLNTGNEIEKIPGYSNGIANLIVSDDHKLVGTPLSVFNPKEPNDLFTLSKNGEMLSKIATDTTTRDAAKRIFTAYLRKIGNRITYRNPQTDTIYQTDGATKKPMLFIKLTNPLTYQKKQGNNFLINAETANELLITVLEMRVEESSEIFGIFPVQAQSSSLSYRIDKHNNAVYRIDRFQNDLLGEYSALPDIMTIGNHIFLQKSAPQIKQFVEEQLKAGKELTPALKELDARLNEDDNPVIIVGTLK